MAIIYDDAPKRKIIYEEEPEIINPIKTGIKAATDPFLSPVGLSSSQKQMQNMYANEREKFLESDTPIIGKEARSRFSDKPFVSEKIDPSMTMSSVDLSKLALSKFSPKDVAREGQGAVLDTVANLGTDFGLAKGPKFASNALKALSNSAEEAGGRFLNFYIKPRATGYKFGKNPGRAVAKHIGPTMSREGLLEKVTNKKQELLREMESVISKSSKTGAMVDAGPIFEELQKSVNMMSAFPETYSSQIEAHKKLATDILKLASDSGAVGEGSKLLINPVTAVKIKRALGELPSWNALDPKLGSVSKSARKAYGRFDKEIDTVAPETAGMNRDISELIGAEQGIELGAQREQNKSPVGLIDLAAGGLGSVAGPAGMVKGIALSKFLRSAPFNTTAAAAAGATAKAGRAVAKGIGGFERPSLVEGAFKSLRDSRIGKNLETIPSETPKPDFTLGRNRRSEMRNYLPDGISTGGQIDIPDHRFGPAIELGDTPGYTKTGNLPSKIYPGIEPKKPPVIELGDYLESDIPRMAEEYGIPTYAPPKQVIKDIPQVPRGGAKESFGSNLSEKAKVLMKRVMERRNKNFKA